MNDLYQKQEANVISGSMDAVSIMRGTPVATVRSILGRLGVECAQDMPAEVYMIALRDALCSNRETILMMIPEYMIDFLLDVWENDTVNANQERWNFGEYLKMFGFLLCRRGSRERDTANEVVYAGDMKEEFYFVLKGKKSRKLMKRYLEWEKIIVGFMYYYGLIDIHDLYTQFLKVSSQMVDYETFVSFLKCRCSLWAFGEIYVDNRNHSDYFGYVGVEQPETMLLYIREHPEIPYCKVPAEDLIYVCESGGLDNRWPGISDISTWLVDQMKLDYFRVASVIQEILKMIRNGAQYERIRNYFSEITQGSDGEKEKIYDALKQLYQNVPMFEFKGFSRKEYETRFMEKQLKKKGRFFTIIEGGKNISS